MVPFTSGQDVFQTQADSRFNSFSDPMNPVNMNQGNWGINSSYMTPSYLSPYRPQYQGPQGNSYGGHNPSWGQSANYITNPFRRGGDNYGGNYWQQSTPFFDSAVNRPVDRAASFAQNWGVPIAAGYASYRAFEGMGSRMGGSAAAGLIQGVIGNSMGVGTASKFMSAGRMIGGMAGGLMLPAAIAQAGISGFDAAVMDPFIGQRQTANNLRQNFAGVTFGSGVGDPYQGGGLSRRSATGMATSMSRFGAQDLTFNQKEISTLTDYSARAGLLDNTNSSQLTSRMKEITKQVKLVMAVANTSDFKDAIEILGKLQMAGATGGAASRVMTQLGSFAAMGGISTQKLMNTVGAQGQYLFGANGLTPYVGQLAAGQAYGSMSSAFRSGLLSPALAARMGGVEGATQSAVAGMVSMAQSPYASMYAQNAYLGGGEVGNVVGNVSRFGGQMARGGLSAVGNYNLLKPASMSRLIEERGPEFMEQMLHQLGRTTPGSMRGGRLDAGSAYMMMTQSFRMQDNEARGVLEQLRAYQDPGSVNQMLAGADRSMIDNRLKFMQQHGMDYGRLTPAVQSVLGVGRNIQELGARGVGAVLGTTGSAGDALQSWWNESKFGSSSAMKGVGLEQVEGMKNLDLGRVASAATGSQMQPTLVNESFSSRNRSALSDIQAAAAKGDRDALAFVNSSGIQQKQALYNLAKKNVVGAEYMSSDSAANELISNAGQLGTVTNKVGISSILDHAYGGIKIDGLGIVGKGQFMSAAEGMLSNAEGTDAYNSHKSKLQSILGGGELSPQRLKEILDGKDVKYGLSHGTQDYSAAMGVKDDKDFADQIQKAGGIDSLASSRLSGKFLDIYNSNKGGGRDHELYGAAMQLQAGGRLKGGDLLNADAVDNASLAQHALSETAIDKQRQQIKRLAQGHKIDFSSMEQGLAALDNKESVGVFKDSVTEFSTAVKGMKLVPNSDGPKPVGWNNSTVGKLYNKMVGSN